MTLTPAEISHLKEKHRRIRNAVWDGELQELPLPEGLAPGAVGYIDAARANCFYLHRFHVSRGKEPQLSILFTAEIPHPEIHDDKTLENAAIILDATYEPSTPVFDFLLASEEEGIIGALKLPEAYRAFSPVFSKHEMNLLRARDGALDVETRVALHAAQIIGDLGNSTGQQDQRSTAEHLLATLHEVMELKGLTKTPTYALLERTVSSKEYTDQTARTLLDWVTVLDVRRIEKHCAIVEHQLRHEPARPGLTLVNLREGTHPAFYEELERAGISYVSAGPRYEHPLRTHFTFSKTMRGVDWFFAIDNLGNIARVLGSRAHLVEQNALPEIVQPAESGRYARIDVQRQQYRVPEGTIEVMLESTQQHDGKRLAELTVRVPRRSAVIDDIATYMHK